MIGTEDGYRFSFDDKKQTYTIHLFDTEVDFGRADNIECAREWFDRFVRSERNVVDQARIKWLQDKLSGVDLYSIVRRRWEDELWRLMDKSD